MHSFYIFLWYVDVVEYGACYCALYVSRAVLKGEKKLGSIPERRLPGPLNLSVPVWRCLVCGYLCGREVPGDLSHLQGRQRQIRTVHIAMLTVCSFVLVESAK